MSAASSTRTTTDTVPLVRLGQGDYAREIRPADLRAADAERDVIDLGFLKREPDAAYQAKRRDHLSSHALADFRRCPRTYRRKQLGLVREKDSAAFAFGRATHVRILEGVERFRAGFVVGPPCDPKTGKAPDPRSKAHKAWVAAQTKPVVSEKDAAAIEQMNAAVRGHLFARELLSVGVAERVVRTGYCGAPCQAKIDWLNPVDGRGIVDLKTTRDLDGFERDVFRFGYDRQLAFYRELIVEATGVELEAYLIAVEKDEPFRCGVWQFSRGLLDRAADENVALIEELKRCRERDAWPTRYESLRLLDAPGGGETEPSTEETT